MVSLTTDRTSVVNQLNSASLGSTTVAPVLPSLTTVINTATIGWRGNLSPNVQALSVVVLVTRNAVSSTGASNFVLAVSSNNVVPLAVSVTGTTSSWTALNLPFGNIAESSTFPSFANKAYSLINSAAASASISASNPSLTSLASQMTITPTTGVNWLNVSLNYPLGLAPTASPMVFPYTIWGYGTAKVNVIVNSPPAIQSATFTTNQDTALSFSLANAITDADSNTLTVKFTSLNPNVTITTGGTAVTIGTYYAVSTTFSIVNVVGYSGSVTIGVTANDGCATTDGSIQFTIVHVNQPPTVQSFTITMNRDESNATLRTIDFSKYVTDSDSPTPQVYISTLPSSTAGKLYGGASFGTQLSAGASALNNQVLFNPTLYYYGNTTFNFYAQDTGLLQSSIGTVTIVVNYVNYPPTSSNVTLTVDENAQLTINQITATDIDNDPLTMIITKNVGKGVLKRGDGTTITTIPVSLTSFNLLYTPALNEYGAPYTTFEYKFNDGKSDSKTYVATINVNFVNQAPTASDFNVTTNEGTSATLPFSSNIADVENSPLQIVIVSLPDSSLGKLMVGNTALTVGATIAATSTVSFAPVAYVNMLWNNNPTFKYQAYDGQLSSKVATVTVLILPVNNPPTISVSTTTVTARRVTGSSFTFTLQDFDLYDNLTLVVVGSNLGVPSQTTGALKYNGNTLNSGSLTNLAVDLFVNPTGSPITGSLSWVPGDLTPDNFTAYVDLAAKDQGQPAPSVTSASVRVTLKVASNQPPTIVGTYAPSTDEDTTIPAINLKGTDPDSNVQATTLSITFVTVPSNGELKINNQLISAGQQFSVPTSTDASSSTYSVSYKPYLNNNGDSFSVYFTDALGSSSATTVINIAVAHVNHAPTTQDLNVTLDENTVYTFSGFPANDVDNIDTLSLVIVSLPAKGTLTTNTGGSITAGQVFSPTDSWKLKFTPGLNDYGAAYTTFTFKIRDSSNAANSDSTVATATINVNFINQAPTGADATLTTTENTPINISFSTLIADVDNTHSDLKVRINSLPSNTIATLRQSSSSTTDDVSTGSFLSAQSVYLNLVPYKYGVVSFSYSVFDGLLFSTVSYTVQVTINHVNHAPMITATSSSILSERVVGRSFSIYVQDYDVNDTLTVQATGNNVTTINGTLSVTSPTALTIGYMTIDSITVYNNNDGTVKKIDLTWTPSNFASDSLAGGVTFVVTDQGSLSSSVTVGLVVSQNKPPVAYQTTAVTTNEDTTSNDIRIEGYDPDAGQGTMLTATLLTLPKLGTLIYANADVTTATTLSSPSSSSNTTYCLLNYRPTQYTYGTDSFSFYFTDNLGSTSNVVTVSVTVTHVNHAPTSQAFTITLDENTVYTITQFSVSDPDKIDTHTLVITKLPALGSLLPASGNTAFSTVPANVASGSWQLRYSPALNGYGAPYTYFSFKMLDSANAYSPEYNVTVNVNFINQAPTGANFVVNGTEDVPLTIDFSSYINDVDNTPAQLYIQLNSLPATSAGALVVSANDATAYATFQPFSSKSITFSSSSYWNGATSFTYSVFDGALYSAVYTVTINMAAVNNPPVVSVSPLTVVSVRNTASVFTVTVQDVDVGDTISVFIANHTLPSSTTNGYLKLVGSNGNITNTASQITLKSNMANPAGAPLTFDMSWTATDYTPDNFVISMNIFATDHGQPPPSSASNFVPVKLTVSPNTAPTSSASAVNVDEDSSVIISFTGTDVDSNLHATTLKVVLVSLPQLGTLQLSPSNASVALATPYAGTAGTGLTTFSFVYIPTKVTYGSDSFTYVVQDMLTASSTLVTVPITINHVNHAPTSRNLNITINENAAYTFSSFPADDVDKIDTLSLVIVTLPSKGTLKDSNGNNVAAQQVFSPTMSWNLQFVPVLNAWGTPYTQFTFLIRDSSAASNSNSSTYTCTINVNFVNQAPVANAVAFTTLEDTPVTLSFNSSISDVDNDNSQLSVVIASLPSFGQLLVTSTGAKVTQGQKISGSVSQISYSPFLNANGDDSFTWYAVDPSGAASAIVNANVHVTPVNDPPTSADKVVVTQRNTPVTITNFVVDSVDHGPSDISFNLIMNVDAGILEQTTSSSPANQVSFTYTPPNLDSIYVDPAVPFTRFTFMLFDGVNDSIPYTVSIYIAYSNTPPKSQNSASYTDEDIPVLVTLAAIDLETPLNNLSIKIVSIDPSTTGSLYTDETKATALQANAFLPNHGKTFYYVPVLNTYSVDNVPLANLKFQVYDTEGGISGLYTALVFVNHVNKPASYNGPLTFTVDEDATLTMNLGSAINDPDSPPPAKVQIVSAVSKGTLFVCEEDVQPCNHITVTNGDYIDNLLHQVLFIALPNENGDNYTTFSFVTYDSEGLQSSPYTVTINVTPVNDPPVVAPFFDAVPQRVVMFEDTEFVLKWNVTDIDSPLNNLTTKLTSTLRSSGAFYMCDISGGEECARGEQILPPILVPAVTPGVFRVLFVPAANLYDDRNFATFTIQAFDDYLAPSTIVRGIIRVRPVNDAPVINTNTTLPVTSVRDYSSGVSRTGFGPFVISDIDSGLHPITAIITVQDSNGYFDLISGFNPCTFINGTDAVTANCTASQSDLRETMNMLYYVSSSVGSISVSIFVDDLGNTDWNNTALSTQLNYTILISQDTGLQSTPTTPDNTLTIALSVSAGAAVAAVAILIWRLRRRKDQEVDNYFEDLTSNLNATTTSALYESKFQEGSNPFYQNTNA